MSLNTSIIIPQKSIGLRFSVSSGDYDMTGLTAYMLLKLESSIQPVVVKMLLTVLSDGKTGTYTTVGGEFSKPGFYDAELKVYNNAGILLYSAQKLQAFSVQDVFA